MEGKDPLATAAVSLMGLMERGREQSGGSSSSNIKDL